MLWQTDGHRWGRLPRISPTLERQTHRILVRRGIAGERFLDCCLQFGRAITVEQPEQVGGDIAQIGAAFGSAQHECVTGRRCLGEMVEAAMVTGFAFACNQSIDVRGNLDLCAAIVTAHMRREQIGAIENANLSGIGPDRERAPHMGMWNRVVVQIEAHIRLLADLHRQLQFARVRIGRQREQAGLLAFEGLAHTDRGLFPARAIGGRTGTPERGLGIQVVEVNELARGKEVLAYIADRAFDAPLLPVMGSSP